MNDDTERFEATDFHKALLFAIGREIGRVHWNRYQTSWNRWSDDPHIPGIQWHRYVYGCNCPEDDDGFVPRHLDDCLKAQPNFQFENVSFRWYKNPGRGMSVSVAMKEEEWVTWFNRCLDKIREFDIKHSATERYLSPTPDAQDFHSARVHTMWQTDWKEHREVLSQQLDAIREAILLADSKEMPEWGHILADFPADLREAGLLAVACGIVAEKTRAQHKDRPVAESRKILS